MRFCDIHLNEHTVEVSYTDEMIRFSAAKYWRKSVGNWGLVAFVVLPLLGLIACTRSADSPANFESHSTPAQIQTPVPAQSKDLDLTINGVGFGMPVADVVQLLGKPDPDRKAGFDQCAGGYHRDLVYDGLVIDVLSDARGRGYRITQIELTSPAWTIEPDLRIGDPFSKVREVFGEPIYPEEENGCFFYGIKDADGFTKFCQQDGKLVRVHIKETLC
jgi:hypothetical protein